MAQIFFGETNAAPHCYAMSFAAVYSEVVCFLELFDNHTAKKKNALHEVCDEQACSASFKKLLLQQASSASFFSELLQQVSLSVPGENSQHYIEDNIAFQCVLRGEPACEKMHLSTNTGN